MLDKYILRTPLINYDSTIFLKPENLQMFGSYKIRGIAAAIKVAPAEKLKYGLVTISAGNMAQAVAFAARELSIPCTIYIPETAPHIKKEAIRKLATNVCELPFSDVWEMVKMDQSHLHRGLLIHPVFTPGILKGYSEIAHEIIHDLPDTEAMVIPFGVGGLAIGITKVIKKLKPDIAIYTCEPTTAAPMKAALIKGGPIVVERVPSFIDAIGTPEVLNYVFHSLKDDIEDSILVTPDEAMESLRDLYFNKKLLCEGAAAVSLAAAKKLSLTTKHKKIVCILSGGNIDPEKIVSQCIRMALTYHVGDLEN